ncbi:MAG TPA: F0F1 ATP synthase subunit epsilon [Syntrophales bacterium]|jgi:F-type H+-transporting ATPase subunit epsilon|nr:F0F1 ATP synthase subunit epsilon [Syntrophales bacterium]HOD97954.1 F0F1 ATP synthase subunit epsilon [Syntrophales bacterium]HOH72997.1 F0F1 ATP synthase subunit epsilon [Syntrophales bacterium]HPN08671.1 F0F1 ATP synthase subunit epsilon [Syntrophales bacterium]HPX81731.1 F0F1 ATP synthase subunit epsilon [Syntrophales bacterium]
MNLKILLPAEVFLVEEVAKVVVEGENGFFCLLPQHVDFTATLAPGVFTFTDMEGDENYLAVDTGALVKRGQEIFVSTRNAVRGPELGRLKEFVVAQYRQIDEREKKARTAAAKLEVDLLRRFMELRHE